MPTNRRKTFQDILCEVASRNAATLERKARWASWLAKIRPEHSTALYSIKHASLRQLFKVPAYAPLIRDAWTTGQGFLLSIRLRHTNSLVHLPFNQLTSEVQRVQGTWIARRARGRHWQASLTPQQLVWQTPHVDRSRSAR